MRKGPLFYPYYYDISVDSQHTLINSAAESTLNFSLFYKALQVQRTSWRDQQDCYKEDEENRRKAQDTIRNKPVQTVANHWFIPPIDLYDGEVPNSHDC